MSRTRRLPAALAMFAMVALLSAGCGSGGGDDNTNIPSAPPGTAGGGSSNSASPHEKAVKFAECMRDNGVSAFPDPDASGELTIDGVVNGSSVDPNSAAWKQAISACKDLEPPGFTGSKATPKQMSARLEVRPVRARQRREGLPGPHQGWAARRHESNPIRGNERRHEHSQRRDAEVPLVRLRSRRTERQ